MCIFIPFRPILFVLLECPCFNNLMYIQCMYVCTRWGFIVQLLEYMHTLSNTYMFLWQPEQVRHGYTSRQTAIGLCDPWVDLEMDVELLPRIESKVPKEEKEKYVSQWILLRFIITYLTILSVFIKGPLSVIKKSQLFYMNIIYIVLCKLFYDKLYNIKDHCL